MITLTVSDGAVAECANWLPELGTEDPIARDWPEVIATARGYGLALEGDGEPGYDPIADVWVSTFVRAA
jgi:hypothetical protein